MKKSRVTIQTAIMSIVLLLSFSTVANATYLTDIKTAIRPGTVDQSADADPIKGTGWTDITATPTDDSSLQRMFYSNAPESIPKMGSTTYSQGIIYNSAFRSNGGRLFMHHHNNMSGTTVKVALIARNVGTANGSIKIGKLGNGGGVNPKNYLELGAESVRQYFTNPPANLTWNINQGQFVTIIEKTLSYNEAMSFNVELIYNGTFRLYVAFTTNTSTYTSPLSFVQANYNNMSSYLFPPNDPNQARGDAIFKRTINMTYNPDDKTKKRLRLNCCSVGQTHPNDTKITALDYTWDTSSPSNRVINGNFGLLYELRLNTGSWTGATTQLYVGFNPRGGPFQGGFWASEDIPTYAGGYPIQSITPERSGVFGRWGTSYKTVSIDYILPGAANGPNVVVFTGFNP